MKLADRVSQLKPSATLAVTAKAREIKAQGKDILSLSLGEPDFPTPKHICEAAKKAIDEGFTWYTDVPGIPELRAAAAGYFNSQYNAGAGPEHIVISNGGKHSIYNIFQALLNPGDHVLVPAPYWLSYPAQVELAGAKPVIIAASPEKGFKITPVDLENNVTPKTRILVLNSPSNPTGVCYTKAEADAIAQWAVDRDIIVLSDEIYDRLIFDNAKPVSLCSWWKKHPNRFVIVNGVAKTFAMTGWRVGYSLANEALSKAMSSLQSQATSNVCSIAQKAALAALTGGFADADAMRAAFERRRNLAYEIVSTWPDVICPKPQGAFYIFPDVHRHYTARFPDSTSLCTALLDDVGVALVPGAAFGDDRCIRISFAVSDEILEKALKRIEQVLFRK
jgi:aspartate aminotransferase